MKKIFKTMLAVAIAAFTFTSCEDVPEPYELPGSGTETPDVPTEEGTYFSEAFATNFGSFTVKTSNGQDWIIDFSTAKASGYVNKTNIESESYLISPAIDLTNSQGAYLEFEYILAYTNNAGDVKVLITDNFNDANPESSTWEDITGGLKEPNQKDGKIDWNTFHKYSKNIPTKYIGKNNVRIAFYYNATATGSKTWEIKNAALKEGVVEDDEEVVPEEPVVPNEGEYLNEQFATSFGSFIVKTLKGQEWIIDFSTAKASGYVNKTNIESESYLISPAIDLTASKEAYIAFEYILAYANNDGENKVLITDNYNETSPEKSNWEDISEPYAEYVDWNTFHKFYKVIPEKYLGNKNVRIAFYYNASATGSKTWEIRNVILKEGKLSDIEEPENPGGGDDADGKSITLVPSEMGYENAAEMTTITLSDGTTITFDGGGNQNTPKYYNTGKGIRMYPKNSMKVSSSKKIASIVMTCDVYNGTTYNASGDLQANPGTVKVADNIVTFDAINSNDCTITNASTTTGAPSQVRMTQLKIVYAE
ncbi:MAG: choice-of-anchor J domain-containing protein [Prevotella sp.]|nr:choice-of-anchor J domain-containing protein [Prevotella sp.]